MFDTHEKRNILVGLAVFLVTLVVYLLTLSPTVSFWDCGEFIAAGHILGIPHPPGNPLYVLLSRCFSVMFGFFDQVAYRVNLISAFSGAATALFIYLIIVRVVIAAFGPLDNARKSVIAYVGGIVGALFCAFGYTFWYSSVESEVNVPALLFVVLGTWFALVWYQSPRPNKDRYLVMISYLVFLGIGMHMMSMLAMIPVFLFVVMVDADKRRDWRLWLSMALMSSVIIQIGAFLYIGPLLILLTAILGWMNNQQARPVALTVFGILLLWRIIAVYGGNATDGDGQPLGSTGQFMVLLPFLIFLAMILLDWFIHPVRTLAIQKSWRFIFWVCTFAVIGYSVHAYIPIRSALEPIIDENHPVVTINKDGVDFQPFIDYVERKQYGSENFILRMFHRRGALSTQFGFDDHMGYGGFHITQFFHFGSRILVDSSKPPTMNHGPLGWPITLIYLIPTLFMLFGWNYLYQRNRNVGMMMIFLVLIGTVGLVFYMNFADGTRAEARDYRAWVDAGRPGGPQGMPVVHREVRNRDYFFISGFMFFGMWIGIATACLLHLVDSHRNTLIRKMSPGLALLMSFSPLLPLWQNWDECSRKGDWVPYDYAYNLLMSCAKDGILFTNGDNDTFPLWFLQEAEGIRRDVRVVNLSLVNTPWYIHQLKHLEPKVPISFTDQEIQTLQHQRNMFERPVAYPMDRAGITAVIPPRNQLSILRVQDRMVVNIIDANAWKKPVYFAVTVSRGNFMGLDPYLQMQGLAYRIMPVPVAPQDRIDIDRTAHLLRNVFAYRGLGTGKVLMNETSEKLGLNYAAGYLEVAAEISDELRDLKLEIDSLSALDSSQAQPEAGLALATKQARYTWVRDRMVGMLDECVAMMPWEPIPRQHRHNFLVTHGLFDLAAQRADEGMIIFGETPEYLQMKAQALISANQLPKANTVLKKLMTVGGDPFHPAYNLIRNFQELGQFDSAREVLDAFVRQNPGDRRLDMLRATLKEPAAVPTDS